MSTLWVDEDALTVFYAAAGTDAYSENTKFTVSDAETGLAKGEVELTADAYDWYLFYPYTSQMVKPTGLNDEEELTGYFYIGSSSSGSQTQNGLNSTAHLAGTRLPMAGRVMAVPAAETPAVTMKHLATVLKINVTNVYEDPVTFTSVSFTAPVDIIGSAYVDFSGAEPVIFPSEGHVGKTANLTVKDAAELASGATASFYLAVMPFTAASGSTLTIGLTAAEGSCEVSSELSRAYTFEAGKIKELNVDFEIETPVETVTVSEAVASADDTVVTIAEAIVAARSTKGFIATDGTSNVYVYLNAAPEVAVGDEVTINGKKTTYYGLPEIAQISSVVVASSGNEVPYTTLVELDKDNIDAYDCSAADYLAVTGVLEKGSNYYSVRPAGSTRYARTDYLDPSINPSDLEGKTVTMKGYFNTLHSTNNYLKVIATEFEEVSGGGGDDDEVNTLSLTMTQYVTDHDCTVSSAGAEVMYTTLQLNETVRMSTSGSPNCGSFWGAETQDWRLYEAKNGDVTITVAEDCELKSVKFTYNVTNSGVLLDSDENQVTSGTKVEASGSSVTFTVAHSSGDSKAQVRITAVEVEYTGDGTEFPDDPGPVEITTKISLPFSASVYVGETYALNATSNVPEATITYESEDTGIATVDDDGVVTGVADGTVKVYARIEGVAGEYTSDEKYCTVTVSTKPQEQEGTVVFDRDYLAANKNGSKDCISYTNSSDYGTTVVTELRVYKGKELVVSASDGKTITSIKLTCTKNGTTKEGPGCWGEGAPDGYTFESDGPVGTWTGSATSVSFTAKDNQVRIIEMVVTYE